MKQLIFLTWFVISLPVKGQFLSPTGLAPDEEATLVIIGFKDSALTEFFAKTDRFNSARQNLRRSALSARCEKLSSLPSTAYSFDSKVRDAVMRIVSFEGKLQSASLPIFRWQYRHIFWAYTAMSSQEKTFLRDDLKRPQMLNALKNIRALQVAALFPLVLVDDVSGELNPATPLLLKQYFKEIGQLPRLESALAQKDPDLVVAMSQFEPLEMYDSSTLEDLSRRTQRFELFSQEHDLERAVFNTFSKQEQGDIRELLNHPFFTRLVRTHAVNELNRLPQEELDAAAELIEQDFAKKRGPFSLTQKRLIQKVDDPLVIFETNRMEQNLGSTFLYSLNHSLQKTSNALADADEIDEVKMDIEKVYPLPSQWYWHYLYMPAEKAAYEHLQFCP